MVGRFCSSGQKIQASLYWITVIDWTDHTKYQVDRVKFYTRPPPSLPDTIRINIDSSPPRRVQPAQPTGTQGHGIGVPPSLVGRPGVSGELETQQPFCDFHFSTLVCVPGSSDDSRYHRESLGEDATVKIEPGLEASAEERSPQTQQKKGSLDHQCFKNGTDEKILKEEDRSLDLEKKSLPSPQVISGTPADRATNRDLLNDKKSVNTERILSRTTLKA